MQKLLFLSAIAATMGVMASCSEDDMLSPAVPDGNTIAFATQSAKPSTRSAVTINNIDRFTVSAVDDENTPFFNNEEFIFNPSVNVFTSVTPHYWPTTGTLSFYAISDPGHRTVDESNVPMFTYENWAAEKDLVAATVKAGEKQIPYPLVFKHLTSQVYVSAEAEDKTEELTYKLVSVRMTAPSTGTYSFADATGGVGTWNTDKTKTSEYSYDDALPMTFRHHGEIMTSSCYWNILPFADGEIHFDVEYQVLQNGRIISDFTGANAKECIASSQTLLSGKRYIYNFVLTRGSDETITFTLTMSDWENGGSADLTPVDLPKDPLKYIYYPSEKKATVTYDSEKYTGIIEIPATKEKDGVVYNVTYIGPDAFKNCAEVVSVTIPESVTAIGPNAFDGCIGLASLSIPSKVSSIGEKAFYGCTGLNEMELPDNLTRLERSAFEECTSLASIHIPSSLTAIGEKAFYNCSSLMTVSIPSSVAGVGENAFSGCTSLPVIDNIRYADTYLVAAVPKDLTEYHIKEGTRFIGTYAFYGCRNMTSLSLPETVSNIYTDAFQNCTGMTSISLPSSLKSLATRAFCNCVALTSLTLPVNLSYIGEGAFENCSNIPSVSIPNSVKDIGAAAFQNCSKLSNVSIGNSLQSMASMVFYDCPKLQSVSISTVSPPSVGSMVFPSTISAIYVPWDSEEHYRSSWYEYSDKIYGR